MPLTINLPIQGQIAGQSSGTTTVASLGGGALNLTTQTSPSSLGVGLTGGTTTGGAAASSGSSVANATLGTTSQGTNSASVGLGGSTLVTIGGTASTGGATVSTGTITVTTGGGTVTTGTPSVHTGTTVSDSGTTVSTTSGTPATSGQTSSTTGVTTGTNPDASPSQSATDAGLGAHGGYAIAHSTDGHFMMKTASTGQVSAIADGTGSIAFSDGTAVLDATGHAEDVAHIYRAAFHRGADLAGLQYWTGQLDAGNTAEVNVANTFAGSAEFIADYGALSDASFVDQLYQNVLGRSAEAGGESYWTAQLQAGASRGQVLMGFAESYENISGNVDTTGDGCYGEAYRLYAAALARTPDSAGLSYWTGMLRAGSTPVQVAQGFLNSPEWKSNYGSLTGSDYVDALYKNVLGRAPDASGQAYWTAQLQAGATQSAVLTGISDSIENKFNTCAATHDSWVFLPKG